MKHILKAFYITVAIATVFVAHNTPQTIDLVTDTKAACPAGSYNIGRKDEVVCKNEPTGCPYGDSIKLGPDCDKFNTRPAPFVSAAADSALTPDYGFQGK